MCDQGNITPGSMCDQGNITPGSMCDQGNITPGSMCNLSTLKTFIKCVLVIKTANSSALPRTDRQRSEQVRGVNMDSNNIQEICFQ